VSSCLPSSPPWHHFALPEAPTAPAGINQRSQELENKTSCSARLLAAASPALPPRLHRAPRDSSFSLAGHGGAERPPDHFPEGFLRKILIRDVRSDNCCPIYRREIGASLPCFCAQPSPTRLLIVPKRASLLRKGEMKICVSVI